MTRTGQLVLLVGVLLVGCSYPPWTVGYKGEGNFVDQGATEPNHRFILDVGSLTMKQGNQVEWVIGPLPSEVFFFGFVGEGITFDKERLVRTGSLADPALDCEVEVSLIQVEDDQVIVDATGDLKDWTWTGDAEHSGRAFVYKNPANPSIPSNGTRFSAKAWKTYRLKVHVLNSNQEDLQATIRMRGGGWK